jgi:hypothetical protein
MCGRTFCRSCDEEMIHRDHRRGYESASAFGQYVLHLPHTFTCGDVDLYLATWIGAETLLRLVEHKQPGMALKPGQRRVLELFDYCLAHAATCPNSERRLHPLSGAYVLRGLAAGERSGKQRVKLSGPQSVARVTAPANEVASLTTRRELYAWVDGRELFDSRRTAA